MPVEPKPLFRPEALRSQLDKFRPPPAAVAARPKLTHWSNLLGSAQGAGMKETELRDEFLYDVFRDLLGYVSPVQSTAAYTLRKEALIQVDGTFADAAFGRFAAKDDQFVTVLEGKGPGDPLDKPYKSRKRSAVEQAVLYALQLKIDWYLVTNLRETRLYCKRDDTAHFERFDTAKLAADDAEFRRFVFLLGAERVVGTPGKNHLDELLGESKRIGRELTAAYYREYRDLRTKTFETLRWTSLTQHGSASPSRPSTTHAPASTTAGPASPAGCGIYSAERWWDILAGQAPANNMRGRQRRRAGAPQRHAAGHSGGEPVE